MWRVVPGQSLVFREWDGEAVLYNDLSGNTHLLDGGAVDVLLALRAQPLDAATLAARLADRFDADADALPAAIADMLTDLARLDLVESLPC
ncbi:HPr-rel-A system PqqD family peptide chaperone [Massilia norwichensis]|uniref:HPr-rel-A system PqqD family peptide chaperone n=1 Tax=Massilia norwichensis TaxID=1442366 RepID=A0ABT2A9U4_9BURK|nr:HPr-rel-A system PqqD family peptide chaperone [Massilia norwichensis]MCS0590973.1 HPr-rel-A system PqqD family peptide chaperone [Massilia norwichensis]